MYCERFYWLLTEAPDKRLAAGAANQKRALKIGADTQHTLLRNVSYHRQQVSSKKVEINGALLSSTVWCVEENKLTGKAVAWPYQWIDGVGCIGAGPKKIFENAPSTLS